MQQITPKTGIYRSQTAQFLSTIDTLVTRSFMDYHYRETYASSNLLHLGHLKHVFDIIGALKTCEIYVIYSCRIYILHRKPVSVTSEGLACANAATPFE